MVTWNGDPGYQQAWIINYFSHWLVFEPWFFKYIHSGNQPALLFYQVWSIQGVAFHSGHRQNEPHSLRDLVGACLS